MLGSGWEFQNTLPAPSAGEACSLQLVKAEMFLCHAQAPWCYLAFLFYP